MILLILLIKKEKPNILLTLFNTHFFGDFSEKIYPSTPYKIKTYCLFIKNNIKI